MIKMIYKLKEPDLRFSIGILEITINKKIIHKVEYQAIISLRIIKNWFLKNYDIIDNYLFLYRNDKISKYNKKTIKNYIL